LSPGQGAGFKQKLNLIEESSTTILPLCGRL
jgi:hypothetical protein